MCFTRVAQITVMMLLLVSFAVSGCGKSRQSSDAGSDIQVYLLQPQAGTLIVVLTDVRGKPVTDTTVALEINMNHAGMTTTLADPVTDQADGVVDGHYRFPFTFDMLGEWIITVKVTRPDGNEFSKDLTVTVDENGAKGDITESAPTSQSTVTSGNQSGGEKGKATLSVENAVASPAPLAGGTGAVYFTLRNDGDAPVKWTGAESPASRAVELHAMKHDNDVMQMRQITEGIELDPKQSVALTSGTMHLMLVDLVKPLAEGDSLQVTLYFDGVDALTINVPIVGMDKIPR